MKVVPVSAVPSQTFQVILDNQDCDIDLFTRGDHLFMSLYVDGEPVQCSALCLNMVSIIQMPNNSFFGTLAFVDTLGESNPEYSELGSRYLLTYWSEGEEYAPVNRNPSAIKD